MLKHTALAAILSLGIAMPLAAAGTDGPDAAAPGPLQRFMQGARARIERGVRAGRITPAELTRLRTDVGALRARIQAIRRTGAPPTPADRREVRQAMRKLNREIFVANHNRPRR